MTAGTLINAKTVRFEPAATTAYPEFDKVPACADEAIAATKAQFSL